MSKFIVLDGRALEASLKYGSKLSAMAKAHHEVKKTKGGTFYVAELLTVISGEVVSTEAAIGEDSEESE